MDQTDKTMWINKLWDPLEKIEESPLYSKREGIKVAAYCRVSFNTFGWSNSLESQVSHYTHIINNKENWDFVGIYFDNMVSGRKASLRSGFTRMLRHCEEGKVELILVKNISRFSRNTKELIEVIERLKEINVTVFFETEQIESTRDDTTYLLKTYASIAQGEIEALSQSVEWSHQKRALKGEGIISGIYGYHIAKSQGRGAITINKEQAQIVREIYRMYLAGYSYTGIAGELSVRNIMTYKRKNIWHTSSIRYILSNIFYTGDLLVGKVTRDLLSNEKRLSEGIKKQYYIENHHPPIISKETFKQVQEKMKSNRRNSAKPSAKPSTRVNPLLNRVHCGNCGYNFNRNKKRGKDYFNCSTRILEKRLCESPRIKQDEMIGIMLGGFKERFDIENPKIIKTLQRMLVRINQNDHFEFHRLKALTQIQLVKKFRGVRYTDEDIKQMEEKYEAFEKQLVKIEDDRKYRLEAIKWLDNVENFEEFEKQATIEYMRGWMSDITIYSLQDFKIHWIDGEETEIGSCISVQPELEESLAASESKGDFVMRQKNEFEIEPVNQITTEEGCDAGEKEEVKMLEEKRSATDVMFYTLKKQISSSVVMQSRVPLVSKEKRKVAAYIRVSTESDQQEMSLKTKYSYFLYYILRHPNYILADIYIDDGKSGMMTKGRTEFNRMIEDCIVGRIDLIITKSLSRFSRNIVDTLTYIDLLKNLNPPKDIWFQRENLHSLDARSNLMIKLLSVIGQEESLNLGESVAWGKRSLAQRGIVRPGNIGYGYYYGENKEWMIHEEEAKIIQRIYREYREEKTIQQIARSLTEESIPTPNGQKNWCQTTIIKMLRSETYCGNYVYQRYYSIPGLTKDNKLNKGELPMYHIEKNHQAIIDSEEWQSVQEMFKMREEKRQMNREKYQEDTRKTAVFSKKLFCGKCGGSIGYRRHIHKKETDNVKRRWRCYGATRGGTCDAPHFPQEYIEENFTQCLLDMKHSKDFMEYLNRYKASLKITPKEEKQMEELKSAREELNQKLYDEVAAELTKKGKDAKKVEQLIDEIMKLRQQINAITDREEQLEAIEEELDSIMKNLKEYQTGSIDEIGYYAVSPEFKGDIFDECIEKAIVHGDGRIVYKFSSGFEWGASIDYSHFQTRARRKMKIKRVKERADYLKGPEVKKLLEYCIEPKTMNQLFDFSGKNTCDHSFRKHIIRPLLKQGVLRRTFPDQPANIYQRYYSVDK